MAYNVGSFRHRVTILRRVEDGKDARGSARWHFEEDPDAVLWCKVSDVSGRDFYAASSIGAEDIVTFTTRADVQVGAQDRLRWGGRDWDIVAPNHLGYVGDFVQYRCRWTGAKPMQGVVINGQA